MNIHNVPKFENLGKKIYTEQNIRSFLRFLPLLHSLSLTVPAFSLFFRYKNKT